MGDRPQERIGRCCAKCWTPYMCGRETCGCHGDPDARCGSCGVPLYVAPPKPLSFRDVLTIRLGVAA